MKPLDNFTTFQGTDGRWYWHLVDGGNGAIIATGGESFVSKYNAERALNNVKEAIWSIMEAESFMAQPSMATDDIVGDIESPKVEDRPIDEDTPDMSDRNN